MELKIIPSNNSISNFEQCSSLYDNKVVTNGFNNIVCSISDNKYYNLKNVTLEDKDVEFTLYICYPLKVVVEVHKVCNTLYDIIKFIRDSYKEIYKNPTKYGVWGHSIHDLCIEGIKIYDSKYIKVSIGS